MRFILLMLLLATTLFSAEKISDLLSLFSGECAALSVNRPIRVGVLPLTATQDQYDSTNVFGEYVAESFGAALLEHPEKIRLYERQKLAAVAEELALNQSELIDAEQAIALGGVVPVDYLLTGSYTKIGNEIQLSFRLLDVVTGEVVKSSGGAAKFTEGMKDLFPDQNVGTQAGGSQTIVVQIDNGKKEPELPPCEKEMWPLIQSALKDLSSEKAVDAVVDLAVQVPFDTICGHIHIAVVRSFMQYSVYSEKYTSFLMDEISSITTPDSYRSLSELQRYMLRGEMGDSKQWDLWKRIAGLSKSSETYLHRCMVPDTFKTDSLKLIKKRAKEVVDLIQNGTFEKPTPISRDEGFTMMTNVFKASNIEEKKGCDHLAAKSEILNDISTWFKCDTWAFDLSDRYQRSYFYMLNNNLTRTITCGSDGTVWEDKLLQLFSNMKPNREGADIYFRYMNSIVTNTTHEKVSAENREKYRQLEEKFLTKGADDFARLAPLVKTPFFIDVASVLSLKWGIAVEGFDTVDDLTLLISGNSSEADLRRAISLLSRAGESAVPAKERLVRMLRRVDRMEIAEKDSIKLDIIATLGNCAANDSLVVDALTPYMSSKELGQAAVQALAKGGDITVSQLKELYPGATAVDQEKIIKTLSYMKKYSKTIVPFLNELYNKTSDTRILDAIDDALDLL